MLVKARVLDPTHLELAHPISVARGGEVVVVVTDLPAEDSDRQQWLHGAAALLERAYSDAEPDYTDRLLREANPDYTA